MKLSRRKLVLLAAGTAAFANSPPARAQSYPARPITVIVPFPAGGTAVVSPQLRCFELIEDADDRGQFSASSS
jgi:hypothetical protein